MFDLEKSPFYANPPDPPVPLEQVSPREAKPTAQVPFERWHNELSDVLAFATLDDAVKDVIQEVTDEIYSYLKG